MKQKSVLKSLMALVIVLTMCFTLFSFGSSAVSLDLRGSIALRALDRETKEPVSGAVFRLYMFAAAYEKDGNINYIYTEEFKDNGMDMGNFSDAYLPIHLMAYAQLKGIAYIEKATDSTGKVQFTDLPCGAYLVVPAGVKDGYLNPSPFIVTVPMMDSEKREWVYHIDASPKIEADKDGSTEKTYISVKKQWQGTGKHPDSITVTLLKDGVAVETVILSAVNNWYHRWDNLEKKHAWSVVESIVPDGYKVSYDFSQMSVVITNTDEDDEDETTTNPDDTTKPSDYTNPDDTTSPDDTTGPDDTTSPDDITNPGDTTTTQTTTNPTGTTKPTGTTESTTKPEELIDTGQLNWPVPVFSVAGLLLFSIGWAMLNLGKKEEEDIA